MTIDMASTDEKCLWADSGDEHASPPDGSHGERRRRAREILAQQRSHLDQLENQLSEQLQQVIDEVEALTARAGTQHDEQSGTIASLQAALDEARAEHARQIEELRAAAGPAPDEDQLRHLEQERDKLAKRLADAEARLNALPAGGDVDSEEFLDLERRYELAADELRALKRVNAELENKLQARGGAAVVPAAGLDWEAQKQRLLASLEADDDADEETRATIEGTIRITDSIVAQKDQELTGLKQMLDERTADAGGVDPAALENVLNADEVIRQERERLAQAQQEWREKIGAAEIDISVQRAKIARERAELDEKLRQFESEREQMGSTAHPADGEKPTRGRWLARLGLKEPDESK